MIHPTGLGGGPVVGHRSRAIANASWTASSAASIEPQTRTSTETARPYSRRNTSSISAAARTGALSVPMLEGPHFDREARVVAGEHERLAQPFRPAERRIQVRCFDYGESADVLLGFDVGSVRDECLVT